MSLRIIAPIVFLTGCVHSVQPVRSSAANVFALVPVVVEEESAPSPNDAPASDLADSNLDIEIPALDHDFELRDHAPHGLARRCENGGVTTTCGAAPASDAAARPSPVAPSDAFPRER